MTLLGLKCHIKENVRNFPLDYYYLEVHSDKSVRDTTRVIHVFCRHDTLVTKITDAMQKTY